MAAYGFDETSGTQVLDASGNGNHGTLSNATRTTQAKFGRALSFSGSNSLVTVSDSNSLDLTSGMTLSAWVYPTTWASGWKTVIMKERSGGLAYALYANSDAGLPNSTLSIGSYDRQLTVGSHLPSNAWTHLAATYDGTTQRLYVNGVQVGSRAQTGTLDVSANPLRIGGNTVWANEYFQGLIDEVRIYNRALSQAEIAAVSQEPVVKSASPCATSCSLWDNATSPSVTAAADYSAVEVGVKFRSERGWPGHRGALLQGHAEHRHPCGPSVEQLGPVAGPGDLHQRDRLGVAAGEFLDPGGDQGQHRLRGLLPRPGGPVLGR